MDDPGLEDDTLTPAEMQAKRTAAGAATLQPGQVLDRYEVVALLGQGAMGVVYRAHAIHLGRDVALKVIHQALTAVSEARARFLREARAAARAADHPGIAGVQDMGDADGQPFLVMELVQGDSLLEAIQSETLSDKRAADVMAQAARAVHYAHQQGVLHRDLKPANLMIATDGTVRVGDFGLAALALTGPEMTRLTMAGSAVGTPAYMPPEQATGGSCDARSDVYGLGATLFHALTGHSPVPSGTVTDMLECVTAGGLLDLNEQRPGIDSALAAIVDRALSLEPADRHPTAEALAHDLEAWGRGEVVALDTRRHRKLRRGGRPWTAGAIAAITLAGFAAAVAWGLQGPPAPRNSGAADASGGAAGNAASVQRFGALLTATAPPLGVLEDRFHGAPVAADESAKAKQDLAAAVEAEAPAIAAIWNTFGAWLEAPTPERQAAFATAASAQPDAPESAWLRTRVAALNYMSQVTLPGFGMTADSLVVYPYAESPEAKEARTLLMRASERPDGGSDGTISRSAATRVFGAAARALAGDDLGAAIGLLQGLRDDPSLGRESLWLESTAHYLAGDHAAAATGFESLARRGWSAARANAAKSWLCAAVTRNGAGDSPERELERAIDLLDRWCAAEPADAIALNLRAGAYEVRAHALQRTGTEPRTAFGRAIADYDRSVRLQPTWTTSRQLRGRAHRWLGEWLIGRGEDARPALSQSVIDYEFVAGSGAAPAEVAQMLGSALMQLGVAQLSHGGPAAESFAKARSKFDRELERTNGDPNIAHWLGMTCGWQARAAGTRGGDATPYRRAAIAALERGTNKAPNVARLSVELANNWSELGLALQARDEATPAEEAFRRSIAEYERGATIAGAPQSRILRGGGGAGVNLAAMLFERGRDPSAEITKAIATLERATAFDPANARNWMFLGHAHRLRAASGIQFAPKKNWNSLWRDAAGAYTKAIERNPGWSNWLGGLAATCRERAGD